MIVLITGGSNGIGKHIGIKFKELGYKILTADLQKSDYADKSYICDLSVPDNVEKLMEKIYAGSEDPDIIINNVGTGQNSSFTDSTTEGFLKVINTNLTCAYIVSREFAKRRINSKKRYGRIINISSTRYMMSEKNSEAYAASKGGIVSLTHSVGVSLSDYNITVNCISPGWIQNNNYSSLKPGDHLQHPSKRVGKPDDIANACVFLCEPENDFINCQNLIIDGGITKKMIYEE